MRVVHAVCFAVLLAASAASGAEPDPDVREAVRFAVRQLKATVASAPDTALFPRSTLPDGRWKFVHGGEWTSGFFPGALWLAYELTGDSGLLAGARRWTPRLEPQRFNTGTHDVGFIINCSFGNGLRLTGDSSYRAVLLTAARSLATRFRPAVGCIKSWDRRKWPFPVIIDNMMNLELLFRAAREGGDRSLYDLAVSHAGMTMRNHVRGDGGTYHVVSYDSATGAVLARETHQGSAHESVWARGQAWAVYGFTMTYRETRDVRFLQTAHRTADWYLAHLPEDAVPFWDFDVAGRPGEPRDASAAAIAASALFELAELTEEAPRSASYRRAADRMLASLLRPPYLARGSASMGLLNHATGNVPSGTEIDVSLIYAEYYLLEAVLRSGRAARTMNGETERWE